LYVSIKYVCNFSNNIYTNVTNFDKNTSITITITTPITFALSKSLFKLHCFDHHFHYMVKTWKGPNGPFRNHFSHFGRYNQWTGTGWTLNHVCILWRRNTPIPAGNRTWIVGSLFNDSAIKFSFSFTYWTSRKYSSKCL